MFPDKFGFINQQAGGGLAVLLGGGKPWYLAGGVPPNLCKVAYRPERAGSYAQSLINLAKPGTYDAYAGTAPTFTVGLGWTFVLASIQYLKTGYTPADGESMLISVGTVVAGTNSSLCGFHLAGADNAGFLIMQVATPGMVFCNGSNSSVTLGLSGSDALWAFSNKNIYKNGILQGATIPAGNFSRAVEVYVGARNGGSGPVLPASAVVKAFAIYSGAIDDYILAIYQRLLST
jgi:hypothetical protein